MCSTAHLAGCPLCQTGTSRFCCSTPTGAQWPEPQRHQTWLLFPGHKGVVQQESQLWASLRHAMGGGFHNWLKHLGNAIRNGDSFGYAGRWHELPGRRGWATRLKTRPTLLHKFCLLPNPHLHQFIFKPWRFPLKRDFQMHRYLITSLEFNLLLSLTFLTLKQAANTTISWELFKKSCCFTLSRPGYALQLFAWVFT